MAKIKLPTTYCNKLCFTISKFNSWWEKSVFPSTKKEPKNIEIPIIKGIKGAKLIWENTNVRNLLSLKTVANESAKTVWNPQKGETPMKIPKAIESALVLLSPSFSKIFSLKSLLIPFLRKYR